MYLKFSTCGGNQLEGILHPTLRFTTSQLRIYSYPTSITFLVELWVLTSASSLLSVSISQSFEIYINKIATDAETVCYRHKNITGYGQVTPSIAKYFQIYYLAASQNVSSCCSDAAILLLLCNVFILLALAMTFFLTNKHNF